jgi:uroporphyrinogen decarboxylase
VSAREGVRQVAISDKRPAKVGILWIPQQELTPKYLGLGQAADRRAAKFLPCAMLQNDLLLRTARGERTERVPVWVMRQAGRILPEYRAVRAKMGSFLNLVKTPEFACEVTLQPVDLLGVDAAIIFSDILVLPEAMGLPYEMVEARGPLFPSTVRSESDLAQLRLADASGYGYVLEALSMTRKALAGRVPLIGFAGAPFTIYAYMVEGKGSKTFSVAKAMMVQAPELAEALLDRITKSTLQYLLDQIEAGADMVQLFDSWAGVLSPEWYERFALPGIRTICAGIQQRHPQVPITVFAKGACFSLDALGKLPCNVIGLDWTMPPQTARQLVGRAKVLQGNLDPCVLYGNPDQVRAETLRMLDAFRGGPHIANLGHGVYPDVNPDRVRTFIETVKEFRLQHA